MVTTVSCNSARGFFIAVDHGSGYVTLYQHLSRQDVKVGDMVKAGQQIGAVSKPYDHSIIQGGAVALDLCDSPF